MNANGNALRQRFRSVPYFPFRSIPFRSVQFRSVPYFPFRSIPFRSPPVLPPSPPPSLLSNYLLFLSTPHSLPSNYLHSGQSWDAGNPISPSPGRRRLRRQLRPPRRLAPASKRSSPRSAQSDTPLYRFKVRNLERLNLWTIECLNYLSVRNKMFIMFERLNFNALEGVTTLNVFERLIL